MSSLSQFFGALWLVPYIAAVGYAFVAAKMIYSETRSRRTAVVAQGRLHPFFDKDIELDSALGSYSGALLLSSKLAAASGNHEELKLRADIVAAHNAKVQNQLNLIEELAGFSAQSAVRDHLRAVDSKLQDFVPRVMSVDDWRVLSGQAGSPDEKALLLQSRKLALDEHSRND
jgi:hypothetical protein